MRKKKTNINIYELVATHISQKSYYILMEAESTLDATFKFLSNPFRYTKEDSTFNKGVDFQIRSVNYYN